MQDKNVQIWPLDLAADGRLTIEVDAASITVQRVRPGEAPRIELDRNALEHFEVEVDQGANDVRVSMHVQNGAGRILGNWMDWFSPRKNGLMVYVPDDLAVSVDAQAGKVAIADLRLRRLTLDVQAGSVSLRRVSGELKVEATAGKIDGDEISGSLDISSTAGAVRLRIDALSPGRHTIEAEAGSVNVELPEGAPIRVEARASLGSVRDEFSSDAQASAVLAVKANVGSVRVRAFAPSAADSMAPPNAMAIAAPAAVAVKPSTEAEVARVLQMVEDGWLSASDAADLLKALEGR